MSMSRHDGLAGALLLSMCMLPMVAHAQDTDATLAETSTLMMGAGAQYMPKWMGSRDHRTQPIPFLLWDWPNHLSISTVDGLTVDFIGGPQLHGGLYGNYQWGRESGDLDPPLHGVLNSLSPRLQAGGYLEYQFNRGLSFGGNLSHDTQGAGAYLNMYVDQGLPGIAGIEHELELQWQLMNGPAMRRFFGFTAEQAAKLGVNEWQPNGGSQAISLAYDAYLPMTRHTGFVLQVEYLRLLGQAHDSPLVQVYGNANQVTTTLSLVYRQ